VPVRDREAEGSNPSPPSTVRLTVFTYTEAWSTAVGAHRGLASEGAVGSGEIVEPLPFVELGVEELASSITSPASSR
jgi:hypothetical protein